MESRPGLSIEAALASGVFDRVMISTDDEEIAEVARKYGAEVPFMRSEKTANDYATTKDVLEEVLRSMKNCGEHFDTLCCIYPTAPFITPDRLAEAMHLIGRKKGGHPASGSTFQLSAPALRGTG